MSKTVEQVISEIEIILNRSKDKCVKDLIPVTLAEAQPDQAYACLELFHMQNYALIYNAFYVRNGQLDPDYACFPNFTGEVSFIPELPEYFQKTFESFEWTQADGIEFTRQHEIQFLKWFKDCWIAAGGERAKTPTYFCFEKEYQVQDILSGVVISEEECAQKLGYKV